MGEEKRKFSRVPFNVKAVLEAGKKLYHSDRLINLSIGGCLMPVETGIEPGSPCLITIKLNEADDSFKVSVEGIICRHKPGVTAVKFTLIDPDSLFHLQNIIRYNAKNPEHVEEEFSSHLGIL